jgi:hypothetical protein
MTTSLYQIDFIATASGASTRLLSIGEKGQTSIEFSFTQQSSEWSPVGADYGFTTALGGARQPLEWQRLQDHASHAAAAAHAIRHPASLPKQEAGKLRITLPGGETWDLLDAVLLSCTCRPHVGTGWRTLATYRATAGQPIPVAGLLHTAGTRHSWIRETPTAMGAKLHSAS